MIFNSDDFNTLQENALLSLLKRDDLQMEESEIWDKVILWGKVRTPDLPSNLGEWTDENFKSLRNTLLNCLPHVRYFEISSKDVLRKIKPYYKILEKNVWDDILAKHLDPDMSITSLILPPRKKATVQLPLRKVSIITPSSSIITIEHAAMISSWIDRRDVQQFTILQKFNINLNFYLEAIEMGLQVKCFINYVIMYLVLWLL
ncbi:hypothetical protein C2G38_2096457 [Gigaspora rosea]|uniref:BACK domain-containing protein n=1 Tax=Gigaspora rosea TaxID=44941 RepID=A0A397UVB7_9GLOM|nr:hypothetical protein C2G38_2096457 [Gigaspora rosea]